MATVPVLQLAADLVQSQAAGTASSLVPTGSILTYAGLTTPTGWLVCDGASLTRTSYPDLFNALTYQLTVNSTNANATLSSPSQNPVTLGIKAGMFVSGAGIPAGATVSSVTATTIVLSANATATATGVSIAVNPFGFASVSTFNLPDLRGRFVRYDDNMGAPGISGVTSNGAASRDTNRVHGLAQSDALQGHKHAVTDAGHSHSVTHTAAANTNDLLVPSGSFYGINDSTANATITVSSATTGLTVQNPSDDGSNGVPRTAVETRPINIALNAIIKI